MEENKIGKKCGAGKKKAEILKCGQEKPHRGDPALSHVTFLTSSRSYYILSSPFYG